MINKKFFFFFILFIASFKHSQVIAAQQDLSLVALSCPHTPHQTVTAVDPNTTEGQLSRKQEEENQAKRKLYFQNLSHQTKDLVENNSTTENHIISFLFTNHTYHQKNDCEPLTFDAFCNKLSVQVRLFEQSTEAFQGTGVLTGKFNAAKDKAENILKTDDPTAALFTERTKEYRDHIEKNKKQDQNTLKTILLSNIQPLPLDICCKIFAYEAGETLAQEAHYALFGTEKLKKNNAAMRKKLLTLPEKQKKHQEEVILAYLDSNQSYLDKDLNKKLTREELLKATKKFSQSVFTKENI